MICGKRPCEEERMPHAQSCGSPPNGFDWHFPASNLCEATRVPNRARARASARVDAWPSSLQSCCWLPLASYLLLQINPSITELEMKCSKCTFWFKQNAFHHHISIMTLHTPVTCVRGSPSFTHTRTHRRTHTHTCTQATCVFYFPSGTR